MSTRLRIVAGVLSGRRFDVPEGVDVRPTTDRVREATFNSLHSAGLIEGATMLDLFAGSGALGIEALSRGAAHVVFVDRSNVAVAAIEANLAKLDVADRATVRRADAFAYLAGESRRFDVALLDPPYAFAEWDELLARLDAAAVVIESDREVDLGPNWTGFKRKRYAGSVISIATQGAP